MDIAEELRAQCRAEHAPNDDVRWRAADEIERLRHAAPATWQPIETAPKDEGPLLLFCPGFVGQVADEVVIGMWHFDPNRRSLGYWVSDVGVLDQGFAETGPWIEYSELHPKLWARLPRPLSEK